LKNVKKTLRINLELNIVMIFLVLSEEIIYIIKNSDNKDRESLAVYLAKKLNYSMI
jgi:hypothetical protein